MEKSRCVNVQDNVIESVVEPHPSSNKINMDSDDTNSDLDIDDKNDPPHRSMKWNNLRLMLLRLIKSLER